MRIAIIALMTVSASPALAHIGHVGEAAGHHHWLGAAALGAAIAIGLWQGLRSKSADKDEGEQAEDATEEEPQEA